MTESESFRPEGAPRGRTRVAAGTCDRAVDQLCRDVNLEAARLVARRRQRRGREQWSYETYWLAWELLRRSPPRVRRQCATGWPWSWDTRFPPADAGGSAPPGQEAVLQHLAHWLDPLLPDAISRFVLREPGGSNLHTVKDGGPWVALELDLRAHDEVILEAVRVLRRRLKVGWHERKPAKTPWWGDTFSAAEAVELWDRQRSGASRVSLARETAERRSCRARCGDQLDLDAVERFDDALKRLFRKLDAAVATDPLAPLRWDERPAVRGRKK